MVSFRRPSSGAWLLWYANPGFASLTRGYIPPSPSGATPAFDFSYRLIPLVPPLIRGDEGASPLHDSTPVGRVEERDLPKRCPKAQRLSEAAGVAPLRMGSTVPYLNPGRGGGF